ncbi:hypothetical protein HN412_03720 [archaeon]|nr:hypothetical protein [archaeon]MBT7192665.1 hypothetical protein [archaeon]MBT7297847.1 hypothetical protein [archaeon]MBT7496983.1 hypothetical protein [Candidatus Woesearchaeota archaeon]
MSNDKGLVIKKVKEYKRKMCLSSWIINVRFDELPEEVLARTKTKSNYLEATITFNELMLVRFRMDQDLLDKTIMHELFHVIDSNKHRLYLDTVEVLISALRSSFNKRYSSANEQSATILSTVYSEGLKSK